MARTEATIEPVDLAHAEDFRLGALRVRPSLCQINHDDAEPAKLEPRAMQVLVALHREQGRPLSHDDLIEACWGGQIVGDNAVSRIISQLRKLAASFGDDAFEIETLPRVGYLLLKPEATPGGLARGHRRTSALLVLLGAMLVALAVWKPWQQDIGRSQRVALAVLPFEASTPDDMAFAAGLADALRTDLIESDAFSIPGAFSVRELSDGGASLNEIASALDVSFVVEGRVRQANDGLAIDVALLSVENGTAVWSRSYSAGLEEEFDFQRIIAAGIVDHFSMDFAPSSPVEKRDYDHRRYLVAMGLIRDRSPEDVRRAHAILRQLTEDSPQVAEAWAALATASALNAFYDFDGLKKDALLEEALVAARRAVAMDDDLALAHGALGFVLSNTPGKLAESGAALKRAVELDPDDAMFWFWLSNYYAQQNLGRDFLEAGLRTYELEPYWQNGLRAVDALVLFGRHREAKDLREASYLQHPERAVRDRVRASMAMEKGEFSKALELMDRAIEHYPSDDLRIPKMERQYVRSILGLELDFDELGFLPEGLVLIAQAHDDPTAISQLLETYDGAIDLLTTNHQVMSYVVRSGNCPAFLDLVERKTGSRPPFASNVPLENRPHFTILWAHFCDPTEQSKKQLEQAVAYLEARHESGQLGAVALAHFAMFGAAIGRYDDALSLLQQASDMGWPYYLPHTILHALYGPALMDIPFFELLRERPEFQAIAEPYHAAIERERKKSIQYLAAKRASGP